MGENNLKLKNKKISNASTLKMKKIKKLNFQVASKLMEKFSGPEKTTDQNKELHHPPQGRLSLFTTGKTFARPTPPLTKTQGEQNSRPWKRPRKCPAVPLPLTPVFYSQVETQRPPQPGAKGLRAPLTRIKS